MAISKKRVQANKRNAQKSTGPRDTSLTRLNALKHGILSSEILLAGEDPQALKEPSRRLQMELVPQGALEELLVDRIVSSAWRLKRAIRVERDYIQGEYEDYNNFYGSENNKAWRLVVARGFGSNTIWLNLLRYETTIEKQIYKALHELLRLQSARRGEQPPLPAAVDVEVSTDS